MPLPRLRRPDHAQLLVRTIGHLDDDPALESIADDIYRIATWLVDQGATKASTWIRSDEPKVLDADFWHRHGFDEVSRQKTVALDMTSTAEDEVSSRGSLEIVTLDQVPDLEDAAYDTYATTFKDMPMIEPYPPRTRGRWQEQLHEDPSFGPDLVTLVLDGDQVVGIGVLERQRAQPGVLWHAMTGTRNQCAPRLRAARRLCSARRTSPRPTSDLGVDAHERSFRYPWMESGVLPAYRTTTAASCLTNVSHSDTHGRQEDKSRPTIPSPAYTYGRVP